LYPLQNLHWPQKRKATYIPNPVAIFAVAYLERKKKTQTLRRQGYHTTIKKEHCKKFKYRIKAKNHHLTMREQPE